MMKNSMYKKFLIFAVLLVLAFVLCGCDSNVDNELGYVRFADEFEVSRGLSEKNTLMYPVDSLYWAYTAQKVDGLYTEGESEVLGTSGDTGSDGIKVGGYKLRPVKQGPATGLRDAEVGPFATGDWIFKVYGYLNYTVDSSTGKGKFDGLVYSGKTATLGNVSRVVKVASGTGEPVVFELTEVNPSAIPEKGILGFEALKLTVPEDMRFFGTSEIKVKVFDVTDAVASDTTLLGTSTTTVSADKNPSDANPVALNNVVFKTDTSNVLDKKLHTLRIVAEYHDAYTEAMKTGLYKEDKGYDYTGSSYAGVLDTGYALIGEYEKKVDIRSGVKTVLYGDLNDITDGMEGTSDVEFGPYVAKILKSGKTAGSTDDADYDFYSSLEDAVTAFSAAARPIILLRDIDDFGKVSKAVTIDPKDFAIKGLVGMSLNDVTVLRGAGSYILNGNKAVMNFHARGTTVEIYTGMLGSTSTADLKLTVDDASADIWHTGYVRELVITAAGSTPASNIGYHAWATVADYTTVTKGFIDIGQNVSLGTLTLGTVGTAGDVLFKGTLTSKVTNIDDIRDGHFKKVGAADYTAMDSKQLAAFKKVVLNANGGTGSVVTLYGIDGMYMNLPTFAAARATGVAYGNPVFKKTVGGVNLAFVNWSTETTPSESPMATTAGVSYADGGKIVVGLKPADGKTSTDPINLYAQWAKLVGGTVYYVSESNNAYYTFYDADGKQLTFTGTPTVDSLVDAKSYYVSGKAANAPDRFYVFNSSVNTTTKNYLFCVASLPDSVGLYDNYSSGGKTYTVEQYGGTFGGVCLPAREFPQSFKVGTGRSNTEYFMNLDKSGKTAQAMYNPANYANASTTVWGYLKAKNSASAAGCNDWYVPSAGEARKYMEYCTSKSITVGERSGWSSTPSSWSKASNRLLCAFDFSRNWDGVLDLWHDTMDYAGDKNGVVLIRSF